MAWHDLVRGKLRREFEGVKYLAVPLGHLRLQTEGALIVLQLYAVGLVQLPAPPLRLASASILCA